VKETKLKPKGMPGAEFLDAKKKKKKKKKKTKKQTNPLTGESSDFRDGILGIRSLLFALFG